MELKKAPKYYNEKIDYSMHVKLLNFLIKKGKKEMTRGIVSSSLQKISIQQKIFSATRLLWSIFKELHSGIEVRVINKRGRQHFVPFKISYYRQTYLVTKWLLQGISLNKERLSIKSKLSKEIASIFFKNSESKKQKKDNDAKVIQYKSNIHYRW